MFSMRSGLIKNDRFEEVNRYLPFVFDEISYWNFALDEEVEIDSMA